MASSSKPFCQYGQFFTYDAENHRYQIEMDCRDATNINHISFCINHPSILCMLSMYGYFWDPSMKRSNAKPQHLEMGFGGVFG
jgi:hypothetical protein